MFATALDPLDVAADVTFDDLTPTAAPDLEPVFAELDTPGGPWERLCNVLDATTEADAIAATEGVTA